MIQRYFHLDNKLIFTDDETVGATVLCVLIIKTPGLSVSHDNISLFCSGYAQIWKLFFNYYLIWMYEILACTIFFILELEIVFSFLFSSLASTKSVFLQANLQIYAFGNKWCPEFYWKFNMEQAFLITDRFLAPSWEKVLQDFCESTLCYA